MNMEFLRLAFCLVVGFIAIGWTTNSMAQSDLAIGDWKAHLPFRKSFHVTESENKLFFAAEWGLLSLDKADNSPAFLTKVDGLSDVGLSLVKYNEPNQTLLITYQNSNIDVVREDEIINFNEIQRNNQILGDKTIHNIQFHDNKAYLSCAFGLVQFDTDKDEFGFTMFSPFTVYSSIVYQDDLYIGTEGGIFKIGLNTNLAFEDFGNWRFVASEFGLDDSYACTALEQLGDQLYAVINHELVWLKGNPYQSIYKDPLFTFKYLSSGSSLLIAGLRCITGCTNQVLYVYPDQPTKIKTGGCHFAPNYAIQSESKIWYADEGDGFRNSDLDGENCDQLFFNSPFSHNVSEITIHNSQIYVASGGVNGAFSYQFRRDGLFIYDNLEWSYINVFNNQTFKDKGLWDIFTVAVNPDNGKLYVGSYLEGLIEMEGEEILNVFAQENSSIGGTVGDPGRERISGLQFDLNGNLWISNYLAANPLSVYTADGEWKSFNFPNTTLTQIAIDRNGYKWIVVQGNAAGLLVLDTGNDPLDERDDQSVILSSNNSALPTNNVNCVEADLDGTIWVGTLEGPVIFQCGEDVFNNECEGFQKKVVQDDNVALLLEKEDIKTIAVDGANRKWFGTRNGIFVQSPGGDTLVTSFNEQNSPLLDNNIIDIAVDLENGEVFIGTNKGIVEYRTNATFGPIRHVRKAYAFPNPVRPDYHGPIAIRGLARDADIIITDVGGQLVFKTKANGGTAIWNGNDLNGVKAASGVYLVYSTSSQTFDEPDAIVTKILLIHPGE